MKRTVTAMIMALMLCIGAGADQLTASARTYYGHNSYYRDRYREEHPVKAYMNRHPYQKTGAIGAGAGAAIGAVTAGEGNAGRGAVRGAVIGGAAGLGFQYLKRKGVF